MGIGLRGTLLSIRKTEAGCEDQRANSQNGIELSSHGFILSLND